MRLMKLHITSNCHPSQLTIRESGNIFSPASLLLANYQLPNNDSSLDQFVDLFFKDRYASPSDYKIINTENTTLGGLMAKRFTMYDYNKGPVPSASSTSKVIRVLAVDNKSNGYAVKYDSIPGMFDKYFLTAQNMINSLELNQNISHITKHVIVNTTTPIQSPVITNMQKQQEF